MESRFRSVFLVAALLSPSLMAQEMEDVTPPPVVVVPDVERRDIHEADIDTEDFEIGIFGGNVAIEDFSHSTIAGARLTYHISEGFFTEVSVAQATAGQTSFEILSGGSPFLTEEERDYLSYDLSLGYKLNGEIFLTPKFAINSDLFFVVGAGSTDFGGDERFTVNFGAGYRMLLTDWLAVRIDARDYVFDSELIGPKKTTHNISYNLGLSVFF